MVNTLVMRNSLPMVQTLDHIESALYVFLYGRCMYRTLFADTGAKNLKIP